MDIRNDLDEPATYEILGGPVRMILSTCELAPGEVEVWDVPLPLQQAGLETEVRVRVGDDEVRASVGPEASVRIVRDDDTGELALAS